MNTELNAPAGAIKLQLQCHIHMRKTHSENKIITISHVVWCEY